MCADLDLLCFLSIRSSHQATACADRRIRSTVAGLEPGLRDASTPITGLIDNFETEGGLNWQLRTRFFNDATSTALTRELDTLHERVRGE